MKKILAVTLSAILLLTLMSCGTDPFKGVWVGTDELGNTDVTIEFDGAGKVTTFDNSDIYSKGTYRYNGDSTITISLDAWDEEVTFVYDTNDINDGILMLHDVKQIEPGYVLQLQK